MRAYILTLLLLLFPLSAHAAPAIGQPAPAFTAAAIDGSTVKLSDYKGKIVVLEWNNPGCPFVHKHYDGGNMQKLQAYAGSQGVIWLTVNSSGENHEGFMTANQAQDYLTNAKSTPAHYILDAKGAIGKLYSAKSTPHMFVIDAKGNLAYMGAIDDQPTPDPVSLGAAHNYVRAAIDSLIAGKAVATASTQAYGCSVKYSD